MPPRSEGDSPVRPREWARGIDIIQIDVRNLLGQLSQLSEQIKGESDVLLCAELAHKARVLVELLRTGAAELEAAVEEIAKRQQVEEPPF